jgi:hypothetical protein
MEYGNVKLYPFVPSERVANANSDWTSQANKLREMTYHDTRQDFINHELSMGEHKKFLSVNMSGLLFRQRADENKIEDRIIPMYLNGSKQYVYNDLDRSTIVMSSYLKNLHRQSAMQGDTTTGVFTLKK